MQGEADDSKGMEGAIQNAINRGEFDNLKGKGKPLDLNEYFDTPEEIRLGYSLLKNAGFVPEEVQLINLINELKVKIRNAKDDKTLKGLQKQMRDAQLNYDLLMERNHKR